MTSTSILCPHCQQFLDRDPARRNSLACPDGHRFDAAKQGYFNFLTGKGTNFTEDSAGMVAARDAFQARHHYRPLATAITLAATEATATPYRILDAGAGTGYYLGVLIDALAGNDTEALALDISRYAMRRAAKVRRTTAVVWDVWRRLPTADASRDVVLNCFAPHNADEFRRVLAPGGVCLVVTALPEHLEQVRSPLGMLGIGQDKESQLVSRFADTGLELTGSRELRYPMQLDTEDLFNLAFMGPAGHHLDPDRLRHTVRELGPQQVTAAFGIYSFA
ncbi:methyltransferase domain-containing protein [Glutamicibacter sp. MNS18]|uniref:putative RNA methyltransferase n=1 Tax=Glutamicibacter sp. MNS18 TaxID=2989817 RepID=UPI0022359A05|nr:methyltransferase domain-containing protein [Glutamicibacter sp. MNS18]MCW4464881.1 methyltransferase domain-containing protein [Glutamicibacter sp. MNS18]